MEHQEQIMVLVHNNWKKKKNKESHQVFKRRSWAYSTDIKLVLLSLKCQSAMSPPWFVVLLPEPFLSKAANHHTRTQLLRGKKRLAIFLNEPRESYNDEEI